MAFRFGILVIFILSLPCILLAQCDDDDDELPSGSMSVSGGGCSPAVFSLSFSLSSNDADDDDSNDDVFNVSYRVGGRSFTLSGVADGHSVEHTLTATGTAVLVSVTYQGCTVSINSSTTLEVSAGPSISITATTPTCGASNGSLAAGGSGGSSPYEYSLDGGAFQGSGTFGNLSAGSYTVTVRDANGCTSERSQTLTAGSPPNLSISSVVQPGCGQNNGSFTAQGSSGATPYQYSLNGGTFQSSGSFSNLAAGSYTVTVRDANGCTGDRSQTLNAGSAPNLSISSVVQPGCGQNNGSFTAQGSSGASPYQYSLNGGTFQSSGSFSSLAAGSYTVTVRDANGCTGDRSQTLSAPGAPSLSFANVTQPGCGQNNGSFTAQGSSGATPYQYSLNGGTFQSSGSFSSLAAGSYTVTVRDANGCTGNRSQTLSAPGAPSLSFANVTQPGCGQNNGSFTAQGSSGATPYQYSLNGGAFQSSGSFSSLAAGTYSVTVRDANGCTGNQSQTLSAPGGPSLSIVTPLQPSCNEANGAFTAQASGGRTPYEYALNNGSYQNVGRFGNLAAGAYTVSVRDANGCVTTITTNLQGAASPNLSISNLRQPTCTRTDGQIQVQAQGGLAPYSFAINGGSFQNSATFTGLGPGNYMISVQDSRNCRANLPVALNSANGSLVSAAVTGSGVVSACLFENLRLQGNLPAGTSGSWSLSNNLGTLANAQNAQTTFRPQAAGKVEAIWTLSVTGCANYSQAKIQITIPAAPAGKDFSGIEVNKDPVSLKLYSGAELFELNVLQQGKKGSGSIGADNVLIYTPKAGANGADTLYYTFCAAECPNACDTNWVALVLDDETAICELEKIDPRALFPEGITPNDDGYNDRLVFNLIDKLGCPSNYAKSDITIFNRWGDKVFVQEPYENQWTGTSRDGGVLPPGVYYYVLRVRPEGRKEFVKFGSVSIFK